MFSRSNGSRSRKKIGKQGKKFSFTQFTPPPFRKSRKKRFSRSRRGTEFFHGRMYMRREYARGEKVRACCGRDRRDACPPFEEMVLAAEFGEFAEAGFCGAEGGDDFALALLEFVEAKFAAGFRGSIVPRLRNRVCRVRVVALA